MSYDNAIADLSFLAARFQGLLELVPLLEHAGSVENTVREADLRLVDLRQQVSAASLAVSDYLHRVEDAKAEAERITSEAYTIAQSIRSTAVAEADVIRSSASEVAAAYKQQAQNDVDEIDADITLAHIELNRVRAEVVATNQTLFDAQEQLTKLRASLT